MNFCFPSCFFSCSITLSSVTPPGGLTVYKTVTFIMAYYNHRFSLRRRLSIVADIVAGCRVGFVALRRRVFFLPVRKSQFDWATFPFMQMVGYATAAPLAAYPKALFFFENSKSLINGENSMQKNPGEMLLKITVL